MKRYRLVEVYALSNSQMYLQEGVVDHIKNIFSPLENKTIPLDWNNIEKRLGGPVPKDVRARVEKECGGLTFKGHAFISWVVLICLWFRWTIVADWKLMTIILFFLIGVCSMYILRAMAKKRLSRTGIDECVRCAEAGELKSEIAWKAVFSTSKEGQKINNSVKRLDDEKRRWNASLIGKIGKCCAIIVLSIATLQFLGVV